MTTPNGRPSVNPSPTPINGLQGDNEVSHQAHPAGSSEPAAKIVGTNMTDVHHAYTEGATVANDQSSLNPVGTQPEQRS
jgi:hypothetical protein